MSTYYEVQEHLTVSKSSELTDAIKDSVLINISELAALKILGFADICRLTFSSESGNVEYDKALTLEEIKTLVETIGSSDTFDLAMYYEYAEKEYIRFSQLTGPWEVGSMLDDMEDEDLAGIFYSMWNHADCSQDNGILCAYGDKDGKFYNGKVEPEEVKEFPKGAWYTSEDTIFFEGETNKLDMESLAEICKGLTKYSLTDDLQFTNEYVCFWLSNLSLENEEMLRDIISKSRNISEITGDPCLLTMYFTDTDADTDMRLLTIEFDENQNPKYLLTEV